MNIKKQHHTPRFYLNGFTFIEKKKSLLWVFEKETQKWFKSTPDNIGFIRGFYDVEIEGNKNIVENFYAEVEKRVAPIFRKIIENETLPEDQERAEFLYYITLQALRVPSIRSMMSQSIDLLGKILAERAILNKDVVQHILSDAKEGKYSDISSESVNEMTYEDMVEFVQKKRFKVVPSQSHMVASQIMLSQELYPLLWQRSWSLYVLKNTKTRFITSDNPVTLFWKDEKRNDGRLINSPGFGLRGTEVSFALTPTITIIGDFKGPEQRFDADESIALKLNDRILNSSYRQIYAQEKAFS
ncbi:MAG: DUF4238 domain-containing protein [Candidatus Hatepunaea meridiana]|nr:DUF4238 domain-containing protein [Candidatus Hatepunaea meridiana]